jgi:hypothetical protein
MILQDYFSFLQEVTVTHQDETILDVLKSLVRNEFHDEQFCMDMLNDLLMTFFERLRLTGRLHEFKEDYLD